MTLERTLAQPGHPRGRSPLGLFRPQWRHVLPSCLWRKLGPGRIVPTAEDSWTGLGPGQKGPAGLTPSSQRSCHQVNNALQLIRESIKQARKGSPDRVLPAPVTWTHATSSRQLQPPRPPLPPDLSFLRLLTWCGQRPFRIWMGRVGLRRSWEGRSQGRALRPAPASECVLGKPWAGAEQVFHGSGILLTADGPGT